jgi:hypothetical protein
MKTFTEEFANISIDRWKVTTDFGLMGCYQTTWEGCGFKSCPNQNILFLIQQLRELLSDI